jgi:hypothetical protein
MVLLAEKAQTMLVVLVAGVLFGMGAQSTHAVPLNLVPGVPDIVSSFINVDYSGGTLTASGFSSDFAFPSGTTTVITGGTFDLSASIDIAGTLSGGSLDIGGTIAGLGFNSGTLLTGNLTALGFIPGGGDPLEFVFDVTGGDAAGLYGISGGVILTSTDFPGSFGNNFASAPLAGLADTFGGIPEPVTVGLCLFGQFAAVVAIRRRRSSVSSA